MMMMIYRNNEIFISKNFLLFPENQATTFYTSKVLADSGVCDVCGSECFCSAKVLTSVKIHELPMSVTRNT